MKAIKKMYAVGGTVPNKERWMHSGRSPMDPSTTEKQQLTNKELLERITHQKALEALKRSGVGGIDLDSTKVRRMDTSGNPAILDNNYAKTISLAKERGLYDMARQEAVKEFRNRKA
jgi:hypothetical protein